LQDLILDDELNNLEFIIASLSAYIRNIGNLFPLQFFNLILHVCVPFNEKNGIVDVFNNISLKILLVKDIHFFHSLIQNTDNNGMV